MVYGDVGRLAALEEELRFKSVLWCHSAVAMYSSPVALEKFMNQWGIWWFVQAYGRVRLAPFCWRPS